MIPKRVLIAFATLAVLLFFWQKETQHQKTVHSRQKLLAIGAKNISSITFINRSNDKIEILKNNGQWRMLNPIKTIADKWRVKSVIQALDNAYLSEDFTATDLTRFGIGENGSIIIGSEKGDSIKIQIGRKNPSHSSLYISLDNKSVRMVPAAIEKKILPTLFELRAKNFTATALTDIRQIKIESAKGDYTIIKDKNEEKWRITSPVDESADKYKASRLFADIAHLSASGFIHDDVSKFIPPFLTVTVTDNGGKPEKVIFGAQTEGGNRFVKSDIDGGRTGRVPSDLLESIPLEYKDLIDKKIISFDQAQIKNISIDDGDSKYKIITTKRADKSNAPAMEVFVRYGFADSKDKTDQSSVGRYLLNLANYEYLETEKPEKRETGKRLVIYFDDGSKTVIKGSKTGSTCHLAVNDKRYLQIECALLPKIFPAKKEMTERSLFSFKNKDAGKIEIKIAGRKINFVREGEAGMIVENAERVKLDRLRWNRLLWFLHSITYDQVLAGKIGSDKKERATISIYNTGLESIEKFTFYESGATSFAIGEKLYVLPAGFAIKQLRTIIDGLYFGYNGNGKREQ